MFELGKKDSEAANAAARKAEGSVGSSSGSPASGRRPSTGQAIIGQSIQINGDVKGDEDLMIEGDVSGTVELRNNALTVGKEGTVKANIFARSITVDGTTDGDLFASERISIRATANVRGNLLAPRISLEDGARFKGSIEMDQQAVDKVLGTAQAKSGARQDSSPVKPQAEVKATASGQASVAGAGR